MKKCETCGQEVKESIIQRIPSKELEWGAICDRNLQWEEAKEWCKEQGDGWRLPTRLELLQAFEDKIDGFESGSYWSGTENSATDAWAQYFSTGNQYNYGKAGLSYVRCVRGR